MTERETTQAIGVSTPVEGHNYRLATHPEHGAHGYEVGYWPAGADLTNPSHYVVVARCFTQAEAAALAAMHNANPQPKAESAEAEDESEEHHGRSHGRRR